MGGYLTPIEAGTVATFATKLAEHVMAEVAGIAAEVLYAGSSPGLIGSVTQVNVRIPSSVQTGLQSIRVGTGSTWWSQSGATIAVK